MASGDFQETVTHDPAEPVEALAGRVPAAWCVYLLGDAAGRPVQLLCVKNLRASLRRRLGGPQAGDGSSRRVDYAAVVRTISWTRVDSDFEQDVVYLEAARRLFPETYAAVLGFRPAWFVEIDPTAAHPRFVRTHEPHGDARAFGPLAEKGAAQKLAHAVEELFDLCRDPAALVAAPAGPCQWRQMGKCVGPCDGTVSLPAYRALIAHAADVLGDPDRAALDAQLRMRHAAAAQEYESAAGIKAFSEKLAGLRSGNARHVRPVGQFRFLAVMRGRREGSAKLFAVRPGEVVGVCCLREAATRKSVDPAVRAALAALGEGENLPVVLDAAGRERVSLVTHHLFPSRKVPGVFLHAGDLDSARIVRAVKEVWKRPKAKEEAADSAEDEGEIRGLGAA